MPKIRTNRTVMKRFKKSATGKLHHGSTMQNHRMKKKANEQRRLDRGNTVEGKMKKTVVRMLGGK